MGDWFRFPGTVKREGARILISAAIFAAVFLFYQFGVLQRFELVTYDMRSILKGTRASDPRLVVIEISDASVAKIGRWPWDRNWHAALIKILSEAEARAIVFDVIFSEPSQPQKDAVLAEAIRESKRVYLAEAIEGLPPRKNPKLLASLPQFVEGARGVGHINLQPDIDGVMRRIPLVLKMHDRPIGQLALSVALDEWGASMKEVISGRNALFVPLPGGGLIKIPLDGRGNFLINWAGRWKNSFTHYSYLEVMSSYAVWKNGGSPHVPMEVFKGKICFVGMTAVGLFDIRPTPLEPAYPAVGVNLTVLDNLLGRHSIRKAGYGWDVLVLAFLALVLFVIMKLPSYFKAAVLTLAVAGGYVLAAIGLFVFFDIWIPVIHPLLLILMTYFFATLYNQLSIAMERSKLLKLATRDSLTGLFNVGHFKLLLRAEMTSLSLRRERNLCVLMSDVDNFKRTNDAYGHVMGDAVLKEVAACIKSSCRALDVAARYGGEEFILMLPGASLEEAFKVGEKIRKAVNQKTFFYESGSFQTSISIGATQVSPDEQDIDAIVARADRALYEAKRTGKNKVVISAS